MENGNKETKKDIPGKKELKQQLADKMEAALPELRGLLGEKKFAHRLRKAAKLLMEGLHKQDVPKKKNQPAANVDTKKSSIKKTAAKNLAVKPSALLVSTPKKAKSAKKGGISKQ